MPTIEETIEFIKMAHAGQTDKGGDPYYLHPVAVMNSLPEELKSVSIEVKLAALLHDIFEMTNYTRADLEAMGYTKTTLDIVQLLSNRREDGSIDNRPYEEKIDSIIDSGNEGAILVKYADLLQNTRRERWAKSGQSEKFRRKYTEPFRKMTEAVWLLDYINEPPPTPPLLPPTNIKEKSKDPVTFKREEAQSTLVSIALEAALRNLYWQFGQKYAGTDRAINTEITLHKHVFFSGDRDAHIDHKIPLCNDHGDHCDNPMDALKAIHELLDNDVDRVAAFNALADLNGIDIHLRTSGAKSRESILEKAKRRYSGDVSKVKDIARIMVISRDPMTLQFIAGNFDYVVREGYGLPSLIDEGWEMIKVGMLKRTLLLPIDGVPAEIQFVPHEQEQIAGKIVHKLYKIMRSWDTWKANPDDPQSDEHLRAIVTRYNRAAVWINELFETEKKGHGGYTRASDTAYWKSVNRTLAEIDAPIDPVDEDEAQKSKENGKQAPSAKDNKVDVVQVFTGKEDLESYREYLRHGSETLRYLRKQNILPLPIMSARSEVNKNELEKNLLRLINVRQITVAYCMQKATEDMRMLWRDKAYELMGELPEEFIQGVCRGRGSAAVSIEYKSPATRLAEKYR